MLMIKRDAKCYINMDPKKLPIWWYHPDHLGSSSYLTDFSGLPSHYYNYLPFGEEMVSQNNSSYNNVYRFSGKELDQETGLSYFGARYYDPKYSFWLSVDPLAEKFPNASPYNYCLGNPVNLVDPDGKEVYYSANGVYLGRVGKSNEIRIFSGGNNANNLKLIKSANNPKSASGTKEVLFKATIHAFKTTNEAAENWAVFENDKAKKNDKESGAAIYKIKLSTKGDYTDSDGAVSILSPTVEGGKDFTDPDKILNIKMPGKLSGFVHSHSNGDDNFSGFEGDKGISADYNIPVFLVNKKIQLKVFDYRIDNPAGNGRILNEHLPIYRYNLKTKEIKR